MGNATKALATLAAMMGAAMSEHDQMFNPDPSVRQRWKEERERDKETEKPSQTTHKYVPDPLYDFTIQGVTFKAKSRQDTIKMAVRQGVLPNKKKKRKK